MPPEVEATKRSPQPIERCASVWDAIAGTPKQAANLRERSELMQSIAAIVQDSGWTQTGGDPRRRSVAAARANATQASCRCAA